MQYVTLGKTGLKVSRLGFGCMRLPMKGETGVDRELTIPMLRRAHELGINYFDTAVGYSRGDSQRVLGEAFEGMRDKVILSTKNPHYHKNDKDGWWKNLEDSLERLRTDYIDVYSFHDMRYDKYQNEVLGDDGLYKEMLKAREQGLIRHICYSFHGKVEELIEAVDSGLFESMTVQYNLIDRHLEEGIAHAASKGMGVVIMGPVGGGRLGSPDGKTAELIGGAKSTPELALRFVLSNGNVTVALSGMSTMQQLEENVETVSKAGELTEKDFRKIDAAVEERRKLSGLYCTGCNYCLPCPSGVDIPANFEILNLERVFGLTEHARKRYAQLAGKAAICAACGKCLEPCPQEIDIPSRLGELVTLFDERAGKVTGWGELRGGSLEEGLLNLKLRFFLKNFTDRPQKARVEFLTHGEDQVWPSSMEFETLKPFARKQKDVRLTVPYPALAYDLDAVVKYDGAELTEHLCDMVLGATRVEAHSLDASEKREGTTHVPSPLHPVHATEQSPEGHSLDFAAGSGSEGDTTADGHCRSSHSTDHTMRKTLFPATCVIDSTLGFGPSDPFLLEPRQPQPQAFCFLSAMGITSFTALLFSLGLELVNLFGHASQFFLQLAPVAFQAFPFLFAGKETTERPTASTSAATTTTT